MTASLRVAHFLRINGQSPFSSYRSISRSVATRRQARGSAGSWKWAL